MFWRGCMGAKKSILDHVLVPKCRVLTEKEVTEILKCYGIKKSQLPRILETDPIVVELGAKKGDVIEFIRNSPVAGESVYYRVVV